MSEDLEETRKLNNPYYKIMELDQKELQIELNNWSRERLIDWLAWNDRNGVYTDEDSLDEFGIS